jgi:hypothetical protein
MSSDGLHTALETAPPDLKAWLQTQPSLDAAWATCDRADWLLWLARRRPSDDLQERRLVGATALALLMAGASGISRRELDLANAWASQDFDDNDPTGFRATIVALVIAGAVGITLELWLYFRAENPIRSMRRELYSWPTFLVLFVIIRVFARPLLAKRHAAAARGYSFSRAEERLFPSLPDAVARADARKRIVLADLFRKRMAWTR